MHACRFLKLIFIIEWIKALLLRSKLFTRLATKLVYLLPNSLGNLVSGIEIQQESRHAIADFLNHSSFQTINLIDVGCFKGGFLKAFQSLIRKRILSIGIDPIRHNHMVSYSAFVEAAVANRLDGIYDFYEYNDPSLNSLKRIITSDVSHNGQKRNRKFLLKNHVGTLAVRTVKTMRLSTIIKRFKMENEIIHFLKIDVQGCDLEVFLSLGEYIKNCLFVQLETIYSKDKNMVVYENQTIFEEEKPIIEKLGFKLFSCVDFSEIGTNPEADVIFVNEEIIRTHNLENLLRRVMRGNTFFI